MTTIFSFDGTADSFQDLAVSIDGKLEKEVLLIDKNEIRGAIKRTELENGLILVHWSLDIIKDYVFVNKCCRGSDRFYFLTYFFEAQFELISSGEGKELKCKYYHPCTTLYSNTLDMTYIYKGGRSIRCLCVIFSDAWLKEQALAEKDHGVIGMIKDTFITQPEAAHIFITSATEQILSIQLTKEFSENPSWFSLKAYSYNLLNTFLNYILPAGGKASKPKPYMELVIEVEKRIHASLTGTLPNTSQLASDFHISSSTLKRQFKLFYGKNIYAYYLEQKMQLAKEILEKGKSTVTDVANALGYENISHFSAVFKKHFNSSPNEISKSKRKK